MRWLLWLLAALLTAAAGFFSLFISAVMVIPFGIGTRQTSGIIGILILVLMGFLLSLLVRSWWSLLIIPLGYFVGWEFAPFLFGLGWGEPVGHAWAVSVQLMPQQAVSFLQFALVPLLVGCALASFRDWQRARRATHDA
jgi:hypothetical protein